MSRQLLKLSILLLLVTVCCAQGSYLLTTPALIQKHGYPFEEHTVQTADDYILTMHRIPYSPKLNNSAIQRPVAFLMHGLTCASSVWVLNGPGRSLAYILSDAGYDVWLGNARGNIYSKKHVSLTPSSAEFWNFDFHEIGAYDTPDMIDYALSVTGEDQVRYVGHSQGGTTFLVFCIRNPTRQKRIRSAHLLAPNVFQSDAQSPMYKFGGPLLGRPSLILEPFANTEFAPDSTAFKLLSSLACKDGSITQEVCSSMLGFIYGGASPYLNKTQLPDILGIIPAGASFKQLLHFLQLHNSGKFRQYDYGMLRNILEYGSRNPPEYDFSKLDVPIYLYQSQHDGIVSMADMNLLTERLKAVNTLKGVYTVPYPEWNHLDFIFGLNVENVLYKAVMNDIRRVPVVSARDTDTNWTCK